MSFSSPFPVSFCIFMFVFFLGLFFFLNRTKLHIAPLYVTIIFLVDKLRSFPWSFDSPPISLLFCPILLLGERHSRSFWFLFPFFVSLSLFLSFWVQFCFPILFFCFPIPVSLSASPVSSFLSVSPHLSGSCSFLHTGLRHTHLIAVQGPGHQVFHCPPNSPCPGVSKGWT